MKTDKLKFKIILTICDYWLIPDVAGIEFDGETSVEQKLSAEVTAYQLAELIVEYMIDSSISTQGILEGGILWPAVCFWDGDDQNSIYVSPYTDADVTTARKLRAEPARVPVLDNDWQIKQIDMADLPLWGDKWGNIRDGLLKLTETDIVYSDRDDVEARILDIFKEL